MLDKIPTPLSGAICNEKAGWLPPNFDDNCREILNEAVSNLIRKSETDDEDLEDDSFDREFDAELEGDGDGESMYENDVSNFTFVILFNCTNWQLNNNINLVSGRR